MSERASPELLGQTGSASAAGPRVLGARGPAVAILVAFVATNLALWAASAPNAIFDHSPDLASWLEPAKALLQYGNFVDPADPSQPQIFRPPLYHLFLAAALAISDNHWTSIVVTTQAVMLLGIGLVMRRLAEPLMPGSGNLALALALFNPNSLAATHLIQSETLYGGFLILAVVSALAFVERPLFRFAAACAAATAAACLTRPGMAHLAWAMPVGFLVLGILGQPRRSFAPAVGSALLAAVVLIGLLSPWMWHNARGGYGFVLMPAKAQNYYLHDLTAHLEMFTSGRSYAESLNKVSHDRDDWLIKRTTDSVRASDRQVQDALVSWYWRRAFDYPAATWLRAFALSAVGAFLSPGSGQIIGLLNLSGTPAMATLGENSKLGYLGAWWDSMRSRSAAGLAVIAGTAVFLIATRLFGLAGVLQLARARYFAVLSVLLVVIGYHAGNSLIYGTARYRLPVDPLLMLLAAIGMFSLRRHCRLRKTAP